MALPMPRPIKLASGFYHLNVRVPSDLAAKVRGAVFRLPLDGMIVPIKASDKIIMSLRTKDPAAAKERFAKAAEALAGYWVAMRRGPVILTHKQCVALAGHAYRRRVERCEADASLTPDVLAADRMSRDREIAEWMHGGSDGTGEISVGDAQFLAAIARPNGVQLLAWETWRDIDDPIVKMPLDKALEHLFGADVDEICAEHNLVIDPTSRCLLLREVGKAVRDAVNKVERNVVRGDYSPDPVAARFPTFEPPAPADKAPAQANKAETVLDLFGRWKAKHADQKAASTIRRYEPSLASLDAWVKGRDWRSLNDRDIFDWAMHRQVNDGVSAATVNRNDLVAVSSVLAWPTTLGGGKRSAVNPAIGVKLDLPKKSVKRDKVFRRHEITAILNSCRSVKPDRRHPRASASRRWCPWICAYSGARIQEPLWLRKSDVRREDGIWVMDFRQTKDGFARTVPIHHGLVAEGFLGFVDAAPDGYLFIDDRTRKPGATRSPQEMRAAELAAWVRSKVEMEDGLSPNHAWRHTWITYAEANGIPKRFSNRITGHGNKDVSDRYVTGLVPLLAAEIAKFPCFVI